MRLIPFVTAALNPITTKLLKLFYVSFDIHHSKKIQEKCLSSQYFVDPAGEQGNYQVIIPLSSRVFYHSYITLWSPEAQLLDGAGPVPSQSLQRHQPKDSASGYFCYMKSAVARIRVVTRLNNRDNVRHFDIWFLGSFPPAAGHPLGSFPKEFGDVTTKRRNCGNV